MQLLQNSSFSKLHPVKTFPYCKDTLTKAAFSVRHQLREQRAESLNSTSPNWPM